MKDPAKVVEVLVDFRECDERRAAQNRVEEKILWKENLLAQAECVSGQREVQRQARHECHPELGAEVGRKRPQVHERCQSTFRRLAFIMQFRPEAVTDDEHQDNRRHMCRLGRPREDSAE